MADYIAISQAPTSNAPTLQELEYNGIAVGTYHFILPRGYCGYLLRYRYSSETRAMIIVRTSDTISIYYNTSSGGSVVAQGINQNYTYNAIAYKRSVIATATIASQFDTTVFESMDAASVFATALDYTPFDYEDITRYPITYSYSNSTVSGPTEAAVGDTVTVSAVPDVDYGITDQSSQIAVTCNDEPVAFSWDATNQRITFTMPDPS